MLLLGLFFNNIVIKKNTIWGTEVYNFQQYMEKYSLDSIKTEQITSSSRYLLFKDINLLVQLLFDWF